MYNVDLEQFLKKNNLTQSELAEILGVSQGYLSQVNQGKSKLSKKNIRYLMECGKYDISMFREAEKTRVSSDTVTMSREVFNSIQQLIDTINSQQRTIESQQQTIANNVGGYSAQEVEPVDNAGAM